MQFCSFRAGNEARFGALRDDGIVDLTDARDGYKASLLSVLQDGLADDFQKLAEQAGATAEITEVTFDPLIPAPVNCYCAGINYLDHIEETGREKPDYPTLFLKTQQALVGHEQPIVRPKVSERFDFEGEFALVIGKPGRYIAKEDWRSYVAGYTILMDGSIRDFQRRSTDQGKNFNRSSSCGPWFTPIDEAPDFADMRIQTRLNGEVMQDSTVDLLCFDGADLVSYYSQIFAFQPGDIIATGTPGGVGSRREPPVWMKSGDIIEVEISGLGVLRNNVIDDE